MKLVLPLIMIVLVAGAAGYLFIATPTTVTVDKTQEAENALTELKEEQPNPRELGQLFMIGHWADTPTASTTDLIQKYQLGGVIIMSTPENPAEIANWVTEWNSVSNTPLLIAIDQEGGPVSRLKGPGFTQTGQREITTATAAYQVGLERGTELANLGITMNFSPVLDTANNPDSFMYQRVFPAGLDTASLGNSMANGLAAANVTAVIKHFPGHDDTSDDSHLTLPVVSITEAELPAFTSAFAEAIAEGAPEAIMTAHVQFPNIDPLPATLSPFFLTSYLRNTLGFEGLIITDDMSMDAIENNYQTTIATELAIKAGANMILLAAEPESITRIYSYIENQSVSDTALQTAIATSYQKIQELK